MSREKIRDVTKILGNEIMIGRERTSSEVFGRERKKREEERDRERERGGKVR